MGYPIAFLERQRILQILFHRMRDQTKVLVNKKVVSVDHYEDGVLVSCADGSCYPGDIVAGADGIHSKVRREMWRHGEAGNILGELANDQRGKLHIIP